MIEVTAEEEADLSNRATEVLCNYYPNYGVDYCHNKSGIDIKYLKARVQYLGLKVTPEGRSYVNKTKHKKMKGISTKVSSKGGIRYPDKLSDLEKIALFGE